MPFQVSPGVAITERDLTTIVPSVATTAAGFVGSFQWGPIEQIQTVDTENLLVSQFGKPNDDTAEYWFTAADVLSYGSNLQVVRVATDAAVNAVASGAGALIKNSDDYEIKKSTLASRVFAAKYAGELGNSLDIIIIDSTFTALSVTYGTNTIDFSKQFDRTPGTSVFARAAGYSDINDEIHVFVVDRLGLFSGIQGTILEKYEFLSKLTDAKNSDGTSNYYVNVLNNQSQYVWWLNHPGIAGDGQSSSSSSTTSGHVDWGKTLAQLGTPAAHYGFDVLAIGYYKASFSGGVDGNDVSADELQTGFALFANDAEVDVSLIATGPADVTTQQYVIDSIVTARKDCVAFVSPQKSDVVNVLNQSTQTTNVANWFETELNRSSSYFVADSGWYLRYDRYNDVNRWIPLNGQLVGLCVRTDQENDPWFSPAGYTRGQLKNVIKLAFNPRKTDRDTLYRKSINPVVSFPGQGTILYGDKTGLDRPSAFDRINVRRLFIVLEKAIATAAVYQLFEFNDSFSRQQFKSLVEPFLRSVQARRGINDFKVVCDESNNTGDVISRNEFVADIYVKPNYSTNFIQLNFIAVRQDVSFEEVGG